MLSCVHAGPSPGKLASCQTRGREKCLQAPECNDLSYVLEVPWGVVGSGRDHLLSPAVRGHSTCVVSNHACESEEVTSLSLYYR